MVLFKMPENVKKKNKMHVLAEEESNNEFTVTKKEL